MQEWLCLKCGLLFYWSPWTKKAFYTVIYQGLLLIKNLFRRKRDFVIDVAGQFSPDYCPNCRSKDRLDLFRA